MNGITRVKNAIGHVPGTPVARGELTLDRSFVLELLTWRTKSAAMDALPDIDLLIAFGRALKLDLVCIQSGGPANNGSDLAAGLHDIARIADEGLFIFWIVNGAFQTAMAGQDWMPLMMKIADSPANLGHELRDLSDQVVATMARGVAAGVHGIIIADDIAYGESTYMSPNFVGQHLLPAWQSQVAAARQLNVPIFPPPDSTACSASNLPPAWTLRK